MITIKPLTCSFMLFVACLFAAPSFGFAETREGVNARIADLFSTRTFDVRLYQEKPASLDSEKEFSDEEAGNEEYDPAEVDELEYLSEVEIQECAVRFPGTTRVKVLTDVHSKLELTSDDVIALKVSAPGKNLRFSLGESEASYSDTRKLGAFVKGVCVFQGSNNTRINIDLERVVLNKLELFDGEYRSFTTVTVNALSKLVQVSSDKLTLKSKLTILGEGQFICPKQREKAIHCLETKLDT